MLITVEISYILQCLFVLLFNQPPLFVIASLYPLQFTTCFQDFHRDCFQYYYYFFFKVSSTKKYALALTFYRVRLS